MPTKSDKYPKDSSDPNIVSETTIQPSTIENIDFEKYLRLSSGPYPCSIINSCMLSRNAFSTHLPTSRPGASLSCRQIRPVLPPRLLDIIQASWSSPLETMTRVAFAARCRRLDLHSQHMTRDLRARKVGRKPWHLLSA